MSHKKIFTIVSIVRNAYYAGNNVALIRHSCCKAIDLFLGGLVSQGIIQGFEKRRSVLVLYLKHERTINKKVLPQFTIFKKQSFRRGYAHPLSALEKINRGLTAHTTFVSSDRGIMSLNYTCQKKIGGKLLYSVR